jgi:hypothetical protein
MVRKRCDVIHTLALCEMGHFHRERRKDFRDMMSAYFAAQIEFHQKVGGLKREACERNSNLFFFFSLDSIADCSTAARGQGQV